MALGVLTRSGLIIGAICAGSLPAGEAHAASRFVIEGSTPSFVPTAKRVSAADPTATIDITIWLSLENRAALDDRVQKEYDPASPLYHHWLDRRSIGREFGPSAAKLQAVRAFLERSNLAVVAGDAGHFYVRARGTIDAVQRAFHVVLANYAYRGQVYRSNTADPVIEDAAGAYVSAVQGLDTMGMQRALIAQQDLLRTPGKTASRAAAAGANGASAFNAACFPGPTTEDLSSGGALPAATYTGNLYHPGTGGCAYTPTQIRSAYGLNSLYAKGYDGTGQSIAIVTAALPPTLLKDANAFSSKYGLPALVQNQNFSITYYPFQGSFPAFDVDPQLSVEWTHAIAPGANIEMYVTPYAPFGPQDIDPTLLDAVENSGANVVALDWVYQEFDTSSVQVENSIAELAAATGVALNLPSGDAGDYTDDDPGYYGPPDVSAPADSPYVTAVGGVSLALDPSGAIQFQSGWGTNLVGLAYEGYVIDTTYAFGPIYGSGGGTSGVFPAPGFQRHLKSFFRKVPDIAWLADPYTAAIVGVSVADAVPSLQYQAFGGTGVANYMFSALWAIADQAAGTSLGQAAPLLYANPGVATDIVPVGSTTNVKGTVLDVGNVTYHYNAATLARFLVNTKTFYSAIWNVPLYDETVYVVTFGTDTSLNTARGWDPVTGLGVPDPMALINAVTPPNGAAR